VDELKEQIINFCNIQFQIMDEKENKLRKEILDCKIQKEFLSSILSDIHKKYPNKEDT